MLLPRKTSRSLPFRPKNVSFAYLWGNPSDPKPPKVASFDSRFDPRACLDSPLPPNPIGDFTWFPSLEELGEVGKQQ